MSDLVDRLRSASIFEELDDAALEAFAGDLSIVTLDAGSVLFEEGDEGDRAFVVLAGEIAITVSAPPNRLHVATCGPGDVVGEMSLMSGRRRNATATARTEVSLATIDAPTMEALGRSGGTGADLMRTVLRRLEETEARVEQARRMSQIGTFTAGVSHELNNPAAALRRTGASLEPAVHRIVETAAALLGGEGGRLVAEAAARAPGRRTGVSAADRLRHVDETRERLAGANIDGSDRLAEELAALEVDDGIVASLLALDAEIRSQAVALVVSAWTARRMAAEVVRASSRITEIIDTLSSYSRLGKAPREDVDVTVGIDDSLALLSDRLTDISVVRQYADHVPPVDAVSAELNQVWTNLIANAADATGTGGTITIRVRADGGDVVVEVSDDGPGIPDDVLPRLFDDFFTTKPPGEGTGLGLAISRRIVVGGHGGTLTAHGGPGSTVFTTRLPAKGAPTVSA